MKDHNIVNVFDDGEVVVVEQLSDMELIDRDNGEVVVIDKSKLFVSDVEDDGIDDEPFEVVNIKDIKWLKDIRQQLGDELTDKVLEDMTEWIYEVWNGSMKAFKVVVWNSESNNGVSFIEVV